MNPALIATITASQITQQSLLNSQRNILSSSPISTYNNQNSSRNKLKSNRKPMFVHVNLVGIDGKSAGMTFINASFIKEMYRAQIKLQQLQEGEWLETGSSMEITELIMSEGDPITIAEVPYQIITQLQNY